MSVSRVGAAWRSAKLLLDHGANIERSKDENQRGRLALMYRGVRGASAEVVKLLISRGADVNAVAHTAQDIPRRSKRKQSPTSAGRITGRISR